MQNHTPIIIHVPHASTWIPESEKKYFVTPNLQHEIKVMTDHFCDDLFDTGDEQICFPVSRLICDPERFRDDTQERMSRVGMGAVYIKCSDGTKLKEIPAKHKEWILREYYDTHHAALETAVAKAIAQQGRCLIIDGHSFYEEALPYEPDQDPWRPDICIGTDEFHTPEKITDTLVTFFRERGYSVAVNRPFAGALVPLRYYRSDKRVMSVMIEINRRLYIDRNIRKKPGFTAVKQDIAAAIRKMNP